MGRGKQNPKVQCYTPKYSVIPQSTTLYPKVQRYTLKYNVTGCPICRSLLFFLAWTFTHEQAASVSQLSSGFCVLGRLFRLWLAGQPHESCRGACDRIRRVRSQGIQQHLRSFPFLSFLCLLVLPISYLSDFFFPLRVAEGTCQSQARSLLLLVFSKETVLSPHQMGTCPCSRRITALAAVGDLTMNDTVTVAPRSHWEAVPTRSKQDSAESVHRKRWAAEVGGVVCKEDWGFLPHELVRNLLGPPLRSLLRDQCKPAQPFHPAQVTPSCRRPQNSRTNLSRMDRFLLI